MSARGPEFRVAGRGPRTCGRCARAWLVAPGPDPVGCPVCGVGELLPSPVHLDGEPELAVPVAVDAAAAARALQARVLTAPFPCPAAHQAAQQPQMHWVPAWLVDARCVAHWRAEIGVDTAVQSTVERLAGGVWRSQVVDEIRPRWSPRAGTADRWADNVQTPALRRWAAWQAALGPHGPGLPPVADQAPILLPDLPADLAWPEAEPALRQRIAEDLTRAAGAQHLRDLALDARWEDLRWTWLLLPVWSATYTDPAGKARVLRACGVTGKATGPVVASSREAAVRASLWAAAGLATLALAAVVALPGIFLWPLLLLTALGGVLGFALLAVAVVPFIRVLLHNARIPDPPDPQDPDRLP